MHWAHRDVFISLTLLYLHLSAPRGKINKLPHTFLLWSVFPRVSSGLTILNIWKVSGGQVKKKIIQNGSFSRLQVSQPSISSAFQLWLSRPCFYLITTSHFTLWAWENISKCTAECSKLTTCGCTTEDFVMPLNLHLVTIKISFYYVLCKIMTLRTVPRF